MNEILTPELKAKIVEQLDKSDEFIEEQNEYIDELQRELSLARTVCYTAKGFLAHRDDPLGGVYWDLLKKRIQAWEEWKEVQSDSLVSRCFRVTDGVVADEDGENRVVKSEIEDKPCG